MTAFLPLTPADSPTAKRARATRPYRILVVFAAAALSMAACSSTPDRSGQSSEGFYSPSFNSLWDVGAQAMRRYHFTPDPEESGKEAKTMISRYEVQLSPFSMKGTREQAILYFHPIEGRENTWSVEANVFRQLNKNIKEPLNPIRADWDAGARNPDTERLLVSYVQSFFISHDVSPEFRARYGMEPGRTPIPAPPPANPEASDPKAAK